MNSCIGGYSAARSHSFRRIIGRLLAASLKAEQQQPIGRNATASARAESVEPSKRLSPAGTISLSGQIAVA